MANFYLELARKVLEVAREPLKSREIIDRAKKAGLIPEEYLRAKTPHKTVHARLAESIRKDGPRSAFYRFAAGTFGLRSNLLHIGYNQFFGKEYKAPIRKKEIAAENVLCVPRASLSIDQEDGFFPRSSFYAFIAGNEHLLYLPRRLVEKDSSFKQVVTYIAVIKNGRVLCYERGSYSAVRDELVGRQSIGFGGHVSEDDVNLFSTDDLGVLSNARRELREELNLRLAPDEDDRQLEIIGIINDNSTAEGMKHVAVAMIFFCTDKDDPTKGELEIRNLHWKPLVTLPNDLLHFEIWSQLFFKYLVRDRDATLYASR
jgi:predicted NUDIX family phosphoesterase